MGGWIPVRCVPTRAASLCFGWVNYATKRDESDSQTKQAENEHMSRGVLLLLALRGRKRYPPACNGGSVGRFFLAIFLLLKQYVSKK